MRTVYWYVNAALSLIPMLFKYSWMKKKQKNLSVEEYRALAEKIVGDWAYRRVKASGMKAEIIGYDKIPNGEAVLFVGNHQSNFDIAVFLGLIRIPKGFVAKAEVLKLPLIRDYMRAMGCVFMDRKNIKKAARAISDGIDLLKAGHSMVIFPEGTRSETGELNEFKSGSFKLATKSGATIVPVTLDGTIKVMLPHSSKIRKANVTVTIHDPIDVKTLSKEEQAALPETVKAIIAKKLTIKVGV